MLSQHFLMKINGAIVIPIQKEFLVKQAPKVTMTRFIVKQISFTFF